MIKTSLSVTHHNLFRTILTFTFLGLLHSPYDDFSRVQQIIRPVFNNRQLLTKSTFTLKSEIEAGLEIIARASGASWQKPGAEAPAIAISLNDQTKHGFEQDLFLWAGDTEFKYRVLLGRLAPGTYTVTIWSNKDFSAPSLPAPIIKSVRPLLFSRSAKQTSSLSLANDLAVANSPLILARQDSTRNFSDLPLFLYYEVFHKTEDEFTVRYTLIFSNEDGGTPPLALMARWGRTTDIEWVYEFTAQRGKIIKESYQGVFHIVKPFTGIRQFGAHPVLSVASSNNNFSDKPTTSLLYNMVPQYIDLSFATRESVADANPWIYRVMAQELKREGHISNQPDRDPNLIWDPTDYVYIDMYVEHQNGTALACEIKLKGSENVYRSDRSDPRLRIDREGFFRTAIRLPSGTISNATTNPIESVSVGAFAQGKELSTDTLATNVKVIKVVFIDAQTFLPKTINLKPYDSVNIRPGESKSFSF